MLSLSCSSKVYVFSNRQTDSTSIGLFFPEHRAAIPFYLRETEPLIWLFINMESVFTTLRAKQQRKALVIFTRPILLFSASLDDKPLSYCIRIEDVD